MSSRLARHEQSKLIRQTLLFGGLAMVLLVAFLFVILPQSVRLISSITSGTSNPFEAADTIPPQTPMLDAPPIATPSATLAVSGLGEAKSEIVLVVNGTEQNRQTAGDDGRFSFEVALGEGDNALSLYAIDESQNESPTSQIYTITRDSEAPKLEIQEPQEGQQFELRRNQQITIKGTSDPNTRISINGRLVFARNDGTFSSTYQLQEGENKLLIEAHDEAGNQTTKELIVTFRL